MVRVMRQVQRAVALSRGGVFQTPALGRLLNKTTSGPSLMAIASLRSTVS